MIHQVSSFEQSYTKKVNTIGFLFLAAHLPVLCVLAAFNGASVVLTTCVMLVILAAPALILWDDLASKLNAIAMGIAAMGSVVALIGIFYLLSRKPKQVTA